MNRSKYTSLVFRGDTDTCIFHADSDKIPFYLIINRDTSFCGKFDSVIHEIGYHLHNPPLIGFNDYGWGAEIKDKNHV